MSESSESKTSKSQEPVLIESQNTEETKPKDQPVGPVQPTEELTLEWADEDDDSLEQYTIYKKHNVENPCDRGLDTYDYEKQWYDRSQIYINTSFCEPALWFDNFYADDRLFDEGVAGTYIRWRNDFTVDEEDGFEYKTRFAATVQLPAISDKLHLTFDSDEDDDLRDIAPDGIRDEENSSLGLQVNVSETSRSKFSAKISFSPKLLLRYRYTYPLNEKVTLRFTQELERKKAVNGARSRFDYEHTYKRNLLFRSSSELSISEDFEGIDWVQAFVLFQRLNKRASLAYEASVNGITEPRTLAIDYRLGVRFRRNFHREWLFYEIAPEYTWPITLDGGRLNVDKSRRSKFSLFFRLEVHFGNASKKRYQDSTETGSAN